MAPSAPVSAALKVVSPDVLVIGSQGMLARDLLARLAGSRFTALGCGHAELDLTRPEQVHAGLAAIVPRLVVNCAAYTAVDSAEQQAERAFAVNREGTAHLADACRSLDIPLIHISTDYVFDGCATLPYREEDRANPLGVYGRSKWEGEEALRARLDRHLIVRTSWLYGVHGDNFVKTILRLARECEQLRIVADQFGCPTWTGDLANALLTMTEEIFADPSTIHWGTYHCCGVGHTTWHGFAEAIIEAARQRETLKVLQLIPISTAEYPLPAPRPAWSVLDCGKIARYFGITPRDWRLALADMIDALYSRP
jgi:dTDP-4-dehydrorhamnose reductase